MAENKRTPLESIVKSDNPAFRVINSNPETAALISKLVRSSNPTNIDLERSDAAAYINTGKMTQISNAISERIDDAERINQLFPEMALGKMILLSSILSPKDMGDGQILYNIKIPGIAPETTMAVVDVIRNTLEKVYGFKEEIAEVFDEALFLSGAHAKAIIPENSIDELINGDNLISTEAISDAFVDSDNKVRGLGFLGNPEPVAKNTYSTESITQPHGVRLKKFTVGNVNPRFSIEESGLGDYLEITDNFNLLKLPYIQKTNEKRITKDLINGYKKNLSLESIQFGRKSRVNKKEMEYLLFKNADTKHVPIRAIKQDSRLKRDSVGRPLAMRFPTESIIPVTVPGDRKKKIGFFVLIDEFGNPVTRISVKREMEGAQNRLSEGNQSVSHYLINKAHKNLVGINDKNLSIDIAAKIYSDIVEKELVDRLRTGLYGRKLEIGENQEIYRIMISKTLANQFTRLIYIPVELMSYITFKQTDSGIGKSLTDDMAIISSLRSMQLFATVINSVKNNIDSTNVNIVFDPKDPDPRKTIETVMHEVMQTRQIQAPLGLNSPAEIVSWISRAGLQFSFENHPAIPQTKIEFENRNIQHTIPTTEQDDKFSKAMLASYFITPEMVDAGATGVEFARSITANNVLLSKRIAMIQSEVMPQVTLRARMIIDNDREFREDILNILKEHKDKFDEIFKDNKEDLFPEGEDFFDTLLEIVLDSFSIELPKPDNTSIEEQTEAFDKYSDALDKVLSCIISTEHFNDTVAGPIGESADLIKATFKALLQRQWLADNGYMNEVKDLMLMSNPDGTPNVDMIELIKTHMQNMIRSSTHLIKDLQSMAQASAKDLEGIEVNPGTPSDDGGSDSGGGDDGMNIGPDMPDDPGATTDIPSADNPPTEAASPEDTPPEPDTPE